MWMQGVGGVAVPTWAVVLRLAEQWHVPPWVIEDGCSEEWWERTSAFNRARDEAKG